MPLLHLHVEEELDALRGARVAEHLRACAACRARAEVLRRERLWLLEAAVRAPLLPERFSRRLVERIRAEMPRPFWRRVRGVLLGASAVAAAAAAALLLGPWDPSGPGGSGEAARTAGGTVASSPSSAAPVSRAVSLRSGDAGVLEEEPPRATPVAASFLWSTRCGELCRRYDYPGGSDQLIRAGLTPEASCAREVPRILEVRGSGLTIVARVSLPGGGHSVVAMRTRVALPGRWEARGWPSSAGSAQLARLLEALSRSVPEPRQAPAPRALEPCAPDPNRAAYLCQLVLGGTSAPPAAWNLDGEAGEEVNCYDPCVKA